MNPEDLQVVITLRDIYDKVVALDAKVTPLVDPDVGVVAKLQDHEARVRALEKMRWPLPALAVLVSLASFLLPFLVR